MIMKILLLLIIIAIVCFLILFVLSLFDKKSGKNLKTKYELQDKIIKIFTIDEMCDIINNTENLSSLNFIEMCNLSLSNFNYASHLIKENPQDISEHVKNVYIKTDIDVFNIFTKCVFKEYSDNPPSGFKKQTFFYTTIVDIEIIMQLFKKLSEKFGECFDMNDKKFTIENIEKVSKKLSNSTKDDCHAIWLFENLTFRLQYQTNPPQQFVINILQK